MCEPTDPPTVCLQADPDAPLELRVGDLTLLPGECGQGPEDERGGSTKIVLKDGRGGEITRRLHLPKGKVTTVTVQPDLQVQIDRRRCDPGRLTVPPSGG